MIIFFSCCFSRRSLPPSLFFDPSGYSGYMYVCICVSRANDGGEDNGSDEGERVKKINKEVVF